MATTLHVDEALHKRLRAIADAEHRPIDEVIADAVTRYEREKFWRERHEAYARLWDDPVAWEDYQSEVALLEGGSMDGLENEEPYYTPEEEEDIRAEAARARNG